MDLKLLVTVFATVFLAELGDKTQLATFLYAADARNPRLAVFLGSALALVLASAIGVLAGGALSQAVNPRLLSWLAGGGFVAVGVWMILRA
jgi:putative Ca2+/H+ antiporter (TMEM165/GDT1 family)